GLSRPLENRRRLSATGAGAHAWAPTTVQRYGSGVLARLRSMTRRGRAGHATPVVENDSEQARSGCLGEAPVQSESPRGPASAVRLSRMNLRGVLAGSDSILAAIQAQQWQTRIERS